MTKTEKARYTQAGWKCLKCDVHFKLYNESKPSACLNCGSYDLKMEWHQQVDMTSTVTSLPLEDKQK